MWTWLSDPNSHADPAAGEPHVGEHRPHLGDRRLGEAAEEGDAADRRVRLDMLLAEGMRDDAGLAFGRNDEDHRPRHGPLAAGIAGEVVEARVADYHDVVTYHLDGACYQARADNPALKDVSTIDGMAAVPEDVVRFDHGERTFAVIRDADGGVHAVDGLCTHQGIHLADGLVLGAAIECPKHNGRFDYRTGACLRPPVRARLGTHLAEVRGGAVYILL